MNSVIRKRFVNLVKINLHHQRARTFTSISSSTLSTSNTFLPLSTIKLYSTMSNSKPNHQNRLARSKSPYLLQHQSNPVDWYEWGNEPFEKAKREGKLIFLSIGYSACHWCHVMAHECFENQEIADQMNENFVNVKVDREERPDVDSTYMQVVQALTGRGGWPLSAFLTPEGKAIFGGTYFPPRSFENLMDKLSDMWSSIEGRRQCLESADSIAEALKRSSPEDKSLADLPNLSVVMKAVEHWRRTFDEKDKGFGNAPKFPSPSMSFHLLHRYSHLASRAPNVLTEWNSTPSSAMVALRQSVESLARISRGGIADQLAGGISRYSVDSEWRVPHFEKMLYDQAQLLTSYIEVIQLLSPSSPVINLFKDEKEKQELSGYIDEFKKTSRDIINYIHKDLSDGNGALLAAEDADSYAFEGADKKKEGAFYVWDQSEIKDGLKEKTSSTSSKDFDPELAFKLLSSHYDIQLSGNIDPSSDPHGELTGKNVLHSVNSLQETISSFEPKISLERAESLLVEAKSKLLSIREKRPRPSKDDKVVTAWSYMTISALIKSAEVLETQDGEINPMELALKADEWLWKNAWDSEKKRLCRSWREGKGPRGTALDYAEAVSASLDFYSNTLDPSYLSRALLLQSIQNHLFLDVENGGYFISSSEPSKDGPELPRMKDSQDGAEPAATSVTSHNLTRFISLLDEDGSEGDLSLLTMRENLVQSILSGGMILSQLPHALGTLVTSLLEYHSHEKNSSPQILLIGKREKIQPFLQVIRKRFRGSSSIIGLSIDGDSDKLKQNVLYQRNRMIRSIIDDMIKSGKEEVQVHVCQDFSCGLPLKSIEDLENALDEM